MLLALTVPLALSLRDRARAEQETSALTSALTIAANLDRESLKQGPALDRLVSRSAAQVQGRVIATDPTGIVLADSEGDAVGENFNTPTRPEMQKALQPDKPTPNAEIRHSDTEGADALFAAAPVLDPGLIGAVRITKDIQSVNDAVRRTTISLIAVIGGIGLSIGLVIAVIMSGSLARPLTRLAGTARRLGAGDLSARAHDVSGADEIEELAGSFDEMADRVERTVHAQREFVANASHQLRTPLTGMKLRLESAIERSDSPEMTHDLTAADKEIDRLAATVDRLLVMARTLEEGGSTEIELRDAAERAADRWRERAATTRLDVVGRRRPRHGAGERDRRRPDPGQHDRERHDVRAGSDRRADRHGRASGLRRRSRSRTGHPGRGTGQGDRAVLPGKAAPPGGSGLGLAIARDLAERWGGALSVQSPDGGGTRIEVRFRVASTPGTNGETGGAT